MLDFLSGRRAIVVAALIVSAGMPGASAQTYPSQNVTVVATTVAGPPQSWSATATHSQSAKTCSNATGVIVCV